jgi:hypothetical protein
MLTMVEGVDIMLLRLAWAAMVLAWGAATVDITTSLAGGVATDIEFFGLQWQRLVLQQWIYNT